MELAAKHSPDSPIVLNNLALALARTQDPPSERALELIQQALKLSGPYAEFLDSEGEIYIRMKRPLDAAKSFENALNVDPSRRKTRERLIEAYVSAGLPEMADAQRKLLEDKPEPEQK